MNYVNERTRGLQQGAIRAMFDKAEKMEGVISMGIGEPDMPTPIPICEAATKAMNEGKTHYTPNAGIPELREAIAKLSTVKNVNYNPAKEIIVTNGGMGALSLLMSVIINPGDEILIQDPQWLNYVAQVEYYGGVPVRVPTNAENGFEMEPSVIESLVTDKTKAIMINSPNNPTGCVTSLKTLKEIANITKKHNLLAITDEVYNTLLFDGESSISMSELPGMKERTVVINSFSKYMAMCGWRIGYAAGPADIIDKMTKCQENFNACANSVGQWAAVYALNHPELAKDLYNVFQERRTKILELINKIEGVNYAIPKGAFYVFLNISSFGLSDTEFCNRLLETKKVVCIPGSAFGYCGEGYIRIAYTNSMENIEEAMSRITEFCDEIRQKK